MAVKRRRNPATILETHPLNLLDFLTVEIWWEEESRAFVTRIPELNGISTFGHSEEEALEMTTEMLQGWIQSMEAERKRIPLKKAELDQLKKAVGLG